jgi:hypothetical protein
MADGSAQLVLHCGARQVSREELDRVEAPAPTSTWFPVKHATVVDAVQQSLAAAGFDVRRATFGLARDNHRMFATLDLTSQLALGVSLAVGLRNSTDKSFPIGFCAGSRTFVCDNLAFRSELTVTKKHTRNGRVRFEGEIARAITTLAAFQQHETHRVVVLQECGLTDQAAEALMLRSFESGLVSHRMLPKVIQEWRRPSFPEFAPRTAWSMFNAFTTALGPRATTNPQEHARLTMQVGALVDAAAGIKPFALAAPATESAEPTTAA